VASQARRASHAKNSPREDQAPPRARPPHRHWPCHRHRSLACDLRRSIKNSSKFNNHRRPRPRRTTVGETALGFYERRPGPRGHRARIHASASYRATMPFSQASPPAQRDNSPHQSDPARCLPTPMQTSLRLVTQLYRWSEQRKPLPSALTHNHLRTASSNRSKLRCIIHLTRDSRARPREKRPTKKSPPAKYRGRSTAFPGAQDLSHRPASPPPTRRAFPQWHSKATLPLSAPPRRRAVLSPRLSWRFSR